MEANPANVVVHYWHFDPDFSVAPGKPKPLPFDGANGFCDLVLRYVGDIPPGAMRTALIKSGTVKEGSEGLLTVHARYFHSGPFDEDFVRRAAFTIGNLASTIMHNGVVRLISGATSPENLSALRFERTAWTEHLSDAALRSFRAWSRQEGTKFIENIDSWLGENELPRDEWTSNPRTIGVGVYYFEEDQSDGAARLQPLREIVDEFIIDVVVALRKQKFKVRAPGALFTTGSVPFAV